MTGEKMQFSIQPLTPAQSAAVADLHRDALPRGFISTLSRGFRAALYEAMASARRTAVWVAVGGDGSCLGFIAGTAHIGNCYRDVLARRGLALGLRLLPSLLRPSALRHVGQTLAYPFRRLKSADDGGDEVAKAGRDIHAELLSISVSPAARGLGVGRKLVQALETQLPTWECGDSYRVVTDAEDPRSNAFYVALGFAPVGEFLHHEHRMALYTKPIAAAAASVPAGGESS